MANVIALVGPSGAGKSTSLFSDKEINLIGLDPKETFIINVANKPFPSMGWKKLYKQVSQDHKENVKQGGNYLETSDVNIIVDTMIGINEVRKDIKNIVIEDYQYIMSFIFMEKAREKGYDKFNEIAAAGFKPINTARSLRPDINFIATFHQEKGDDGILKIKTTGKMIDNAITLEGLFTVVLFAISQKDPSSKTIEHVFMTNTDGSNTAKSPRGMFKDQFIPNDMGYVLQTVNKYYEGE